MGEMDHEHIITYVKTSKVTDWKRLALRFGKDREPAIIYRSDDDRTFATYAKKGAVLWIIESHGSAPPSLVARFQVIGQLHAKLDINVLEKTGNSEVPSDMLLAFEYGRKLRWYAVGDPECSRFFGYNNVSDALLKTHLEGKPAPWYGFDKWLPKFGQSLERPRRIKSGKDELEKIAKNLTERSVFLSWKHCDFTKRHHEIRSIVNALVDEGIDCWWDQLALPRSRSLARLTKHQILLKNLLDYGLDKSKVLLALGSQHWGGPSSRDPSHNWTLGEWDRSQIQFAYEIDGLPKDGWPSNPVATFQKDVPQTSVVRHIADKLDELRSEALDRV